MRVKVHAFGFVPIVLNCYISTVAHRFWSFLVVWCWFDSGRFCRLKSGQKCVHPFVQVPLGCVATAEHVIDASAVASNPVKGCAA